MAHSFVSLGCVVFLALGCGQAAMSPTGESNAAVSSAQPRAIIRQSSLVLRVENLEACGSELVRVTSQFAGFVGDSTVGYESGVASWTVRVPADQLDAFLVEARNLGRLMSETTTQEDVSEQVVDLEARLTSKRLEEKRLQNLITEQTGALEDVLAVERELSRVREEIERAEASQRSFTDRIALATVRIEARLLERLPIVANAPFGQQMAETFSDSWRVLLLLLKMGCLTIVALVPWTPLAAIFALVAWRLSRHSRPRRPVELGTFIDPA